MINYLASRGASEEALEYFRNNRFSIQIFTLLQRLVEANEGLGEGEPDIAIEGDVEVFEDLPDIAAEVVEEIPLVEPPIDDKDWFIWNPEDSKEGRGPNLAPGS
ncbi:MAG: hypothetical protein HRU46_09185 [Verrucomicrobiales bacterium]|nr:hypothetical protein [Verrucomicrobiales bacterium]